MATSLQLTSEWNMLMRWVTGAFGGIVYSIRTRGSCWTQDHITRSHEQRLPINVPKSIAFFTMMLSNMYNMSGRRFYCFGSRQLIVAKMNEWTLRNTEAHAIIYTVCVQAKRENLSMKGTQGTNVSTYTIRSSTYSCAIRRVFSLRNDLAGFIFFWPHQVSCIYTWCSRTLYR